MEAIKPIRKDRSLKQKLWENVDFLKEGFDLMGYDTMNTKTHIIPVLLGSEKKTMKAMSYLYDNGIFIPGIRPPTVPEGKSRLRVTVMANHRLKDLEYVLEVFRKM